MLNQEGPGVPSRQTLPATPRALTHVYRSFESKAVDTFARIHMEAFSVESEKDDKCNQFNAILNAANTLLSYSYDGCQTDGKPLTPVGFNSRTEVAIDTLWNLAVANVCSNEILHKIGGPGGRNLNDLKVRQLLDLIAWIQFFIADYLEKDNTGVKVKLGEDSAKASGFDACPDLSRHANRKVDVEAIAMNFSWVRKVLCEMQDLAETEYLMKTRDQTDSLLDKIYRAERTPSLLTDGSLTLSLAEDVFSFVTVELDTSNKQLLSSNSNTMVMTVSIIFSELRKKQIQYAGNFLNRDLETTCGAANDFYRMAMKTQEIFSHICIQCQFAPDIQNSLEEGASELETLFIADGVHAAQSLHTFMFEPIWESDIPERLFGREWEGQDTFNEVVVSVVRTLEDFLMDLTNYLHDDILLRKLLHCLVPATVVFYVKCLLKKAEKHSSNSKGVFKDESKAFTRMLGDYEILRNFLNGLVSKVPSLEKVVEKEFLFLTVMHECMVTAKDDGAGVVVTDEVTDFVFVIHKFLAGNFTVTQHFLGDIWHLINPREERDLWEVLESMKDQLEQMFDANHDEEVALLETRLKVSQSLRLDMMMSDLYAKSKRKRPHFKAHMMFDKMKAKLKFDSDEEAGNAVSNTLCDNDKDKKGVNDENKPSPFDNLVKELPNIDEAAGTKHPRKALIEI